MEAIDWVKGHYGGVSAVLVAVYALARAIVLLTPTPKDNRAVERVGLFITALCTFFGFDPFAGRNIKPPGQKKTKKRPTAAGAVLLCFALALSGCATWQAIRANPRAELVVTQDTFSATVEALTTLRAEGTFSIEEGDQITILIGQCGDYLDKWEAAVLAGKPKPSGWGVFSAALTNLLDYREQ